MAKLNDLLVTGVSRFLSDISVNGTITASAFSGNASTASVATKLGTATVGGTAKPFYLNAGVPTAFSTTIGGASKPVYVNSGTITACSSTVGGTTTPVYMNAGTITACSNNFSQYLPLAGGTMTGSISKKYVSTSWVNGRGAAVVKNTNDTYTASAYNPIWSVKSNDGSWDCGTYISNILYFTYITDTNYNAGTNATTTQIKFDTTGKITATYFAGNGASLTSLNAGNIASGTLAIARGGTGLTASPSMLTNLGSTSAANVLQASPRPGVTGTLPIANGGTGLTASPSLLVNLASTSAANVLQASPRPGVTGALPVANGGTGATTAAAARTNIGAVNKAGDTMTGNLTIGSSSLTNPCLKLTDGTNVGYAQMYSGTMWYGFTSTKATNWDSSGNMMVRGTAATLSSVTLTPGSYIYRNEKLSSTEETPTENGAICWVYE